MKKLLVFLMAFVLLSTLAPVAVLARPAPPKAETPVDAVMTVTWIEDTIIGVNVFPLYDAGGTQIGWSVVDRHMDGELSGSLDGTFTCTYSATVDLYNAGASWGTMVFDTKPGTHRGIIYSTFSGVTAVVGFGANYYDVMFSGQLTMDGGTGIYRHISGECTFDAGMGNPLRLYFDETGHIVQVDGSMPLTGSYTRVFKP